MFPRLIGSLCLVAVLAQGIGAQAPANLKSRLVALRQIPIKPGLNVIPNAEGDRNAQVFSAWRDNGNAWGFHIYMVTMPQMPVKLKNGQTVEGGPESKWSVVGIEKVQNGPLESEIHDTPHTGEDAVLSVRFAQATLDGKPSTLLITAERDWKTSVPQPVTAVIHIYLLKPGVGDVGTTNDIFTPIVEFTTQAKYSDANAALQSELGLPLSADK